MEPIAFYILATITTTLILLMIFQTNPVSSALCLVASFFSLAGLYVLLDAHFVAILQILVYAGAIMVLFIFVIMLLNLKKEELVYDRINFKRILVAIIGMELFAFLSWQFMKIPYDAEKMAFKPVADGFGTAEAVGKLIFSNYVIPFEVIGLLLLAGIVGSILLGRREE